MPFVNSSTPTSLCLWLTLFLSAQLSCTNETTPLTSASPVGGTSAASLNTSSNIGGSASTNGGTGSTASSTLPGSGGLPLQQTQGGVGAYRSSTPSGGSSQPPATRTSLGGAWNTTDTTANTSGRSNSGGRANQSGALSGGSPSGGTTSVSSRGGTSAANLGGNSTGSAAAGSRASGGSSQSSSAAAGATHTWKIMPFGDSITGTTCYPQLLAVTLKENGHSSFEFVGTNTNNQSCNNAPFVKTEGHGGYLVTYLQTDTPPQAGKGTLKELKQWVTAKPDVVLIHYGTNDVWNNVSADDIVAAYASVMKEFRAQKSDVIFFISKIIPMSPSNCSQCGQRVETLNAELTDSWAASVTTATSPVYIIDNWTGISTSTDTSDGVHPTATGAQKMATATASALVAKGLF